MLRFDYTDKDSRQASMSPGVIFASIAPWICCRQFRSSGETPRPSVLQSVAPSLKSLFLLPTRNLFAKPQRAFMFCQTELWYCTTGQSGPLTSVYMLDISAWWERMSTQQASLLHYSRPYYIWEINQVFRCIRNYFKGLKCFSLTQSVTSNTVPSLRESKRIYAFFFQFVWNAAETARDRLASRCARRIDSFLFEDDKCWAPAPLCWCIRRLKVMSGCGSCFLIDPKPPPPARNLHSSRCHQTRCPSVSIPDTNFLIANSDVKIPA